MSSDHVFENAMDIEKNSQFFSATNLDPTNQTAEVAGQVTNACVVFYYGSAVT